jgi:3-deoxy-D-manno-octulosonate 8-phosphate phosphatase (KDO 8-P phosphatase)
LIFEVEKHGQILARLKLVIFDFDGVFTDNTVYVNQDGVEQVRCWRSDGLGLSRLKAVGILVQIVSTEANPVVVNRAAKLKLPCRHAVEDKAFAVMDICRELGIDPTDCMFVGNDINDIPAFEKVGVPVGVADAYPEVNPHILFRTSKAGGFGAVREICDLICHFRKQAVPQA